MLINKGVSIPNPASVEIAEDVNPDRISGDGVIIYSGSKISGKNTLILSRAELGAEGPVTVDNCQVGPGVDLKAGYFCDAVFLENVSMGYGAHVRGGTILEEQASIAHTVGLKQTILFPFVTLGSLINFCDCFMSGGTSRKDHSEVGSSYIHFNFTPNQDKATASLIGDVPRGVMLNQHPIFLGGQGGLVGPSRLEFGTIAGAGTILRKDELRPDRLILEGDRKSINIQYKPGTFPGIKRIVENNVVYIANLIALMHWYHYVRTEFVSINFPDELLAGLKEKLDMAIPERIKRLKDLAQKAYDSEKQNPKTDEFYSKWLSLEQRFDQLCNIDDNIFVPFQSVKDDFLERLNTHNCSTNKAYITVIQLLSPQDKTTGTKWLQGIVDQVVSEIGKIIPTFNILKAH